ncbi:Gamma-glutamylcyclotransferase, AIG2-like [Parasponia andersonii]|uniref:Gamma-glutamylcyclotransferase family protein n=1 Tax=Parasponia andersonii TaxID=3476 RepID=A0A2P5BGY7_PARAD|nr:Gamma-glutamylcyclotransferase, AIG2-like [Parasponia andersonii]
MAENSKDVESASKQSLVFTYGTLKRGFYNYALMQDLISRNDALYLGGDFLTHHTFPLVCGPHGIPYLINLPGSGHRIKGELYSVTGPGLARIDDLEGTAIGHYERLPVRVVQDRGDVVSAEAYFAHRSFGEALWERNGRVGLSEYSEAEGRRYVKRRDRPDEGGSILDDVRVFVAASGGK